MNSQFLSLPYDRVGRRIHYTEWGDATNPKLLICVHGLTRNGRDFDFIAKAMARDYRVICPDVAGRGQSDWLQDPNQYHYGVYARDMAQVIRSISPPDASITWLGTSMGGIIGMLLAANHKTQTEPSLPIGRLILNDVGIIIPKVALQRLASYVGVKQQFTDVDEWEAYLRKVAAPFALSDQHWHYLAKNSCTTDNLGRVIPAYDPCIAVPFAQQLDTIDLTPLWENVDCPVLLIRGEQSDILTKDCARQMQQRINCELIEIAGVGHAPMFMSKDQIDILTKYLKSND